MKIKAQIAMVMNLDKCIGCHTCGVTCKNTWTNRPGAEYMWFNNVETKPGIGYPILWEDQKKHKGGWLRDGSWDELKLRGGNALYKLGNIFHNPDMPTIDEYYEPWTYEYEKLTKSSQKRHQPTARPKSLLTGETMSLKWGPNWEDDLAGGHITGPKDVNLVGIEDQAKFELEHAFMMYLPRICEHCLNPSCVASCPSGAIYKRDEDGIVLVDQDQCRGWRYCTSGCPFKKVYFNWETSKAEKCTLCFPRIEDGLPTVCSETCTGRMRYIGVLLYDADRVYEAANTYNNEDLYKEHLSLFLDPNDPEIIAQAKLDGITTDWIEAAQKSPIYKMAIKYQIALPLHPEYRTLPMVWYIPPLSPFTSLAEGNGRETKLENMFPEIMQMRIPIQYLANLLAAGDSKVVEGILKKMVVMRQYMRNKTLGKATDDNVLSSVGMSAESIEEMYNLLAIAKYKDRFIVPTSKMDVLGKDAYEKQGSTGYSINCSTCKVGEYDGTNDNFHKLNP